CFLQQRGHCLAETIEINRSVDVRSRPFHYKRTMSSERALRPDLPTGVITFLLTDVEDSTGLWRRCTNAAEIMQRAGEIIGTAVPPHGGVHPRENGEGDWTVAPFPRPSAAVTAALEAQRLLAAEAWPDGAKVRVRMAIHTGEAEQRGDHTYGGEAIIR